MLETCGAYVRTSSARSGNADRLSGGHQSREGISGGRGDSIAPRAPGAPDLGWRGRSRWFLGRVLGSVEGADYAGVLGGVPAGREGIPGRFLRTYVGDARFQQICVPSNSCGPGPANQRKEPGVGWGGSMHCFGRHAQAKQDMIEDALHASESHAYLPVRTYVRPYVHTYASTYVNAVSVRLRVRVWRCW